MQQLRQQSRSTRATTWGAFAALVVAVAFCARLAGHDDDDYARHVDLGRRVFERETFDGNGRTCLTCHSRSTGTVSPADAQERFARHPGDPLFRGDGSDDGAGHGVQRMLTDATILVRVPLADNVSHRLPNPSKVTPFTAVPCG